MHEELRALSLEAIKEQILNKLGLKQAPNITGRALPKIPNMSKLIDMYGVQADQPLEPGITHHEEIDEFAAKTESVFALAQPRKLTIFIFEVQATYFLSSGLLLLEKTIFDSEEILLLILDNVK